MSLLSVFLDESHIKGDALGILICILSYFLNGGIYIRHKKTYEEYDIQYFNMY